MENLSKCYLYREEGSKSADQQFTISKNLAPSFYDVSEKAWIFEWEDIGVSTGQSYSYQIKATNDIGLTSESSKLGV